MHVFFLLSLLFLQEKALDVVRAAVQKTAGSSYYYTVQGRHQRTGVFEPPDALTSRIRQFRGASNGPRQLLRGPDGLWQEPDGKAGEKIEGLDPEIASIMTSLREAKVPHRQIRDLLPLLKKGREEIVREVDGISCRVFLFSSNKEELQKQIDAQMEKGIARGILDKPTLVRWGTLGGTVRIYIDKKEGHLVRVMDRRSVEVFYRTTGVEEVKKYLNELDFRFSGQGGAKLNLPGDILKKLGLK